jgi:hypothetical protein
MWSIKDLKSRQEGLQSSNKASLGNIAVIRERKGKDVTKEIHRIS